MSIFNYNYLFEFFLKDTSSEVPQDDQLELLELLESIKKSNTILYLPTGSGKTYLVTLLIKHLGESLTKFVKLFN